MSNVEIATTASNQSASDKVSLREHIESSLRMIEKANAVFAENQKVLLEIMTTATRVASETLDKRLEAMAQATEIATAALDRRLEGMNEFRGQMKDQAATFLTKSEFTSAQQRVEADIHLLREGRTLYVTRGEEDLIHDRLETDIKALQMAKATLDGKASQTSVMVALGLSIAGVLIGLARYLTP